MTLLDILLHPGLRPFEIAAGIVFGLLILEVIANQIGASVLGNSDSDLDIDAGVEADIDVELGADALDLDLDQEFAVEPEDVSTEMGTGALSWLGLGKVPFMIWFTGMLTAFGLIGYVLQMGITVVLGAPLGPWLASALAFAPGVLLGARVAGWIGRLFPKTTTTAISRRSYGRRRGVITVGTARVGNPAQARFTDGHGNMHFAMVEPLDTNEEIPQGADILILKTKQGALKAVRLSN